MRPHKMQAQAVEVDNLGAGKCISACLKCSEDVWCGQGRNAGSWNF
jgi:hypothetical protein